MSTTLDVSDLTALGQVIKGQKDEVILSLAAASPGGLEGVLDALVEQMRASFKPDAAAGARAVIRYDLKTGTGTRIYELHVEEGQCQVTGASAAPARCTIGLSAADFIRMMCTQLNLLTAYMRRKMKVKGDLMFVKNSGLWFGVLDAYTIGTSSG